MTEPPSTWTVRGMTCGHCVASVTEELAALPGVEQVDGDPRDRRDRRHQRRAARPRRGGGGGRGSRLRARRHDRSARHDARRERRARHHGHDLRVLREPDRAQAQQARRGDRERQLRHREGAGQLRRTRSPPTTCSRPSRPPGTPPPCRRRRRTAAGAGDVDDAELASPAPAARRLRRAAVPVVLLAMVPALQFDDWQWLSLTLAAPVAVWGAWPFHRAACVNARHGATTMDTLVSLGVLAAFGWSLVALFFGDAGTPGPGSRVRRHGRRARARSTSRSAAGVTTFLLPAAGSRSGRSAGPATRCAR